jgi:serine/threonine protein kinase
MALSTAHREWGQLTPERWQQVSRIFKSAIDLDGEARAAYVAGQCGADESLRAEVDKLLNSHRQASAADFMNGVAAEYVASLLVDDKDNALPQKTFTKGQQFGSYLILDALGAGGMGEVYLAQDSRLDRTVALKVLSQDISLDKRRMQRFRQEAKVASSLNQPNILTVYEFGEVNGLTFIATEFVDGETLRAHLHGKKLKLVETLDITIQVLSALDAAHEARIVHRDIKPENVMIRRRDRVVKVLDFGLAKLTEKKVSTMKVEESEAPTDIKTAPGIIMGTINYMSPEQAQASAIDERTDLWSTGVMIYEMVAGSMPFGGVTTSHTIVQILEKEPAPLSKLAQVPDELERIVRKAMAKSPEERYQTAKDMLIDLRALRKRLDVEAEIGRTSSPTTAIAAVRTDEIDRGRQKTSVLVFALIAMVVVTAAIFGINMWRSSRARNNAPAATTPPTAERALTYWITVQKFRNNRPYENPFKLPGEMIFERDYQIRLNVRSAQPGHLYILSEGPSSAAPEFVFLFPSSTANQGSSLLGAAELVQIPQESWFKFDTQRGVETVWLVFAEEVVPELEALKEFASTRTGGLITDPAKNRDVQDFLTSHSAARPDVNRGELTTLKAPGPLLVYALRLEHH